MINSIHNSLCTFHFQHLLLFFEYRSRSVQRGMIIDLALLAFSTIKDIFNSLDSRLDSFQLNITKYSTFIANRDKKIETTYNTSLSTGNMVSLSPPPLLSGGATPAVAAQYPPFVEGSDAVRARSEEKREIENRKVLMAQFKENETRYIDILQKELDDIQSKKKNII